PALRTQMEGAVDSILSGPYLTALAQYRDTIGTGSRLGSITITSSNPSISFSHADVATMVATNIANGTLPNPSGDSELFYFVVPQAGSTAGALGGEHSYLSIGATRARFGWTINPAAGGLDTITYFFSHEMGESVTDPEGTAMQ